MPPERVSFSNHTELAQYVVQTIQLFTDDDLAALRRATVEETMRRVDVLTKERKLRRPSDS